MSTYLINHLRIPGGVPSPEALDYLDRVQATAEPYGGKWLAQNEGVVLEGTWPGSVVLMEFPTMTDAQNWYNSPDYQKILPLRANSSINDMILVEGVGEDFTPAGFAQQVRAMLAGESGA